MLSMECQLLLKAITVACANDRDVSLAMVAAMVQGSGHGPGQGQGQGLNSASSSRTDIENNIRNVLQECFEREEFVIIKNTDRSSSVTFYTDNYHFTSTTRAIQQLCNQATL